MSCDTKWNDFYQTTKGTSHLKHTLIEGGKRLPFFFKQIKGPVNTCVCGGGRGKGGGWREHRGVHYVLSFPNGVGHAILSLRKGWVIIF